MEKAEMPHPGHDKHLCYLSNLGFQISNTNDYKMLVRDSIYEMDCCRDDRTH